MPPHGIRTRNPNKPTPPTARLPGSANVLIQPCTVQTAQHYNRVNSFLLSAKLHFTDNSFCFRHKSEQAEIT
jgi:hypothetical protein